MYKILSIDGGGIRGIGTANILNYIEGKTKKPIYQLFDMIVGTSTGGILTCALSCPNEVNENKYFASDIVDLYLNRGKDIFKRSTLYRLRSANGWLMPKYPIDGLEKTIHEYFGGAKLSDALTEIITTAYDTVSRQSFFFKSSKAKQDTSRNYTLATCAIATACAPTFFPPYRVGDKCLIDGGVHSNNPTLVAIAEAISKGIDPKEILVISIGTGKQEKPFEYDTVKKWGALEWVKASNTTPLTDVLLDDDVIEFQSQQILAENNYLRLQFEMPEGVNKAMDNTNLSDLHILIDLSDELIVKNQNQIDKFLTRFKSHGINRIGNFSY